MERGAATRAELADFLARISPKLIYGTIILAAILGSLGDPLPTSFRVIVIVYLSMQAVSIADAFARTIRDDIANRRITPWRRKWWIVVQPSWVMASSAVPIACFGACMLGLFRQETAVLATRWGLATVLLVFGAIARRLSGGGWLASLWTGATVAFVGWLVVQLKLWTKYLPEIRL